MLPNVMLVLIAEIVAIVGGILAVCGHYLDVPWIFWPGVVLMSASIPVASRRYFHKKRARMRQAAELADKAMAVCRHAVQEIVLPIYETASKELDNTIRFNIMLLRRDDKGIEYFDFFCNHGLDHCVDTTLNLRRDQGVCGKAVKLGTWVFADLEHGIYSAGDNSNGTASTWDLTSEQLKLVKALTVVYSLPLRRCRFNAGAQSVEPYGDIIGAVNIDSQAKNAYQTIYESVHGTMINTHLNAIAYSTGLLLGLCHDIKKMGTT